MIPGKRHTSRLDIAATHVVKIAELKKEVKDLTLKLGWWKVFSVALVLALVFLLIK
jgi:hypothetical protein